MAASPLDVLAIILGAEMVTWFLFWLATALVGQPLVSSPPAGIHDVVAFLGSGVTAGVAGATSLLVWFFRRTALPLTTYLTWVSGVSVASIGLVLAITRLLPSTAGSSAEETAFTDGENRMAASNWRQADYYFSKVTPQSPRYYRAVLHRGRAELFMRDYVGAEQRYTEALNAAKTDDERLDARYSIARVRFATGDAKYARDELAELAKLPRFHESPEIIYNLASAEFDLGRFDDAAELIKKFPFSTYPQGLDNQDIWGVAYFLRAKLAAQSSKPDCASVRSDVAAAKALVANVMIRMDPQESLKSCVDSAK